MTQSQIELHDKLVVASHTNIENTIPSLSQLFAYRQRIAQELLENDGLSPSDPKLKNLWYLWNYSNENICKLLGL